MPEYKDIRHEEGFPYLRLIQNIFLKPITESDFYVEPWRNQEFRDCSLIEKDSSGSVELTFVIPETPYATVQATGLEVFLYGAYNRITVCQMRVRGSLYSWQEERHKTEQAKARLRAKINGNCKSDPVNTLGIEGSFSKEQWRKRHALIEIGTVFSFLPRSYAYAFYERG